ncbi:hypothetical protein ACTOB_001257 [Actinoplanes oblitus]|uniref:Minor tail protein n=1 Tax=Actinoplanes oblitus TaxID=3040509 RepID=A0ABY8WN16_9ACTN|nr:hypothetical protein [Actinoplanes oblitus]WIM97709.1 hypothetical protein ACTOB_001257 [Actinoplanes oblitus]
MPFPTSLLPVSVWLAPGSNPVDPSTWVWQDITDDVRITAGISIEEGRADEGNKVDPSKCTLTLDNRSGNYSPRNALGQWYGQLRKNTPLQVRVDQGVDTFGREVTNGWGTSDSGHEWEVGTPSAYLVDGAAGLVTLATDNLATYSRLVDGGALDVDVEYVASINAVTTGAAWRSGVLARYIDNDNHYRLYTVFDPSGEIYVRIAKVVNGSIPVLVGGVPTGVTYASGTKIRTRVQVSGSSLRIRCWLDGTTEPGIWNASVEDSDLPRGSGVGFYQSRVEGNTNSGAMAVSIDYYRAAALLFTGTVPEWSVRWDKSGKNCTGPIVASGILRRLQQGASPLRSPIYRQLTRYNPTAYWPMEDGNDATTAASGITRGVAASGTDVSFAGDDTLPGAATAAKLNTAGTSRISGRVTNPANTPNGYAGAAYFKLDSLPVTEKPLLEFRGTGRVTRWVIGCAPTAFTIKGYDADGDQVDAAAGFHTIDPTKWFAMQLETQEVGGTTEWVLIWHQVGATIFYALPGDYTGSADRIISFTAYAPTDSTSVAHVWIGDNDLPFVDGTFMKISNGYSGELAADRIARLCAEEGVPVLVEAGETKAMGPQKVAKFLDLLRLAEDSDGGILFERGAGLQYRPGRARLNPPVDLALDFDLGHVDDAPEPTDDDQQMGNDWTVTREGGSSARVIDQEHVDEFGRYEQSITLSLARDRGLRHQAAWRVFLGTYDDMRWPSISLNLARNPFLVPTWSSLVLGARMTVDHPPDQVAGVDVDVLVAGRKQVLKPKLWTAELNCEPARPWDVGTVVEGPEQALTTGRVQTNGSTLAADVVAGAGSLSVASTGRLWTTNADHFPLTIVVGGERMSVTAISGPASPQTFTVIRSLNDVDKDHDAGTPVEVYLPIRVCL